MFAVFDIGGTKMRVGISMNGQSLDRTEIVETPADFEVGISLLIETVEKLAGSDKISAVAGGIAGVMDGRRGILLKSPHLSGWEGRPLHDRLATVFDCSVYVLNDAALVGLGEAIMGAGQGYRLVAYLTISTGVGGVKIENGRIDEGALGFEPGQQIVSESKTLEGLVSGTAVEARFGKKPFAIKADSPVWDELAKHLAYGLNNLIVHWSPEVVVLGGSMMKVPGITVEAVKRHLTAILKIFPELPEIKKGTLDDTGGLQGALCFLRSKI